MPDPRLLEGLTPEQRDAVLHRDGPLLILAGAGSGKTRVVTRRIAHLIGTGVPAGAILAITFTNKAAGEMRERVGALLPDARPGKGRGPGGGPIVATFHAFAVRILRRHAERVGYSRGFAILDPDDQAALVREAAVAARVDVKRLRTARLVHAIGRAKERLDDAAFAAGARDELDRAAAEVLPGYRELQRRRDAMDFEDLVANTVRLLEEHDDVREALLDELRYLLIDEYQDTNHSQYRLARLLAGERGNIAVCGDPDQSIYGWRGADMGNILRFEQDFPGTKVVLLERNYRSTATILRASNALISHNAERKDKQLRPTGEEGGQIEVRRCLDERFEAEYVADRVAAAIAQGVPAGEIALIYRASIHARAYEEALVGKNVPCATVGSVSFFERREVKDALAWIRAALNHRDDLAALRALRLRSPGLGKRTLDKVHELQRQQGISIVDACARAGEVPGLTRRTRETLTGFAHLVRDLGREARGPVEQLVLAAITRTGLEDALREKDPQGEERCANLRVLLQAARDADRRGGKHAGARGFLDRLALLDAQDKGGDEARERVTLTTVHAAKGLEFDWVFCVGMEEGLFPHHRALEDGGLEEERRLAYVAFTRARQRLVITYAGLRAARTPAQERRRPSTFIYELPYELLWDPERGEAPDLPEREPEEPDEATAPPTAARAGLPVGPAESDRRRFPPRPTSGGTRLATARAPRDKPPRVLGGRRLGAKKPEAAPAKKGSAPLWARGLVK